MGSPRKADPAASFSLGPPGEAQDAAVAVSLALGLAEQRKPRDWGRVLAVARSERIAVLGWLRSGEYLRAHAPSEVISAWRATVFRADALARAQWHHVGLLVDRLQAAGLHPMVLKGLPLAARLYSYVGARVPCDIDLYIPPDERAAAHEVVSAAGWSGWAGDAPWDAAYAMRQDDRVLYLELHSSLTGDILTHCGPLPIASALWEYEGTAVRAMVGDGLPVYLAANLAKHVPVPLISLFDLETLWAGLDQAHRTASMTVARTARLHHCMRWALAQANSLRDVARGDRAAMRSLGLIGGQRQSVHGHFRLARLADSPIDAARVAGTWILPRASRKSLRHARLFWAQRLRGLFKRRLVVRRDYDLVAEAANPGRSLLSRMVEPNIPATRASGSRDLPWHAADMRRTL